MDTGVIIKENAQAIWNLMQGFKFLRESEVFVGIPQEKNSSRGSVTNAELMYIHTNGSPINRVPPRPTIEPAIQEEATAQQIKDQLSASIKAALSGNVNAAEACMAKAGMIGAAAAQKKFGTGAPNAPITIEGGWMINRKSGKPFYVKGKGSSAPLIDTGNLRASITYVIRRKGK